LKLDTLYLWEAPAPGDCAFQMALDETIFHFSHETGLPVIRFYHWTKPALTFGYSEPYPEDSSIPAIRRYTGGGQVEHGEDLTFLLTLPRETDPARIQLDLRYRWIHESIRDALRSAKVKLSLAEDTSNPATGPCFENPVASDLMDGINGTKIGGGAQRRSRGSVIHQGSIRIPSFLREDHAAWSGPFLKQLAKKVAPFPEEKQKALLEEASRLAVSRYRSPDWNHRR